MTLPLIVLGFFSVTAGFIGIPESFGLKYLFHHWREPEFEYANAYLILESTHSSSTEFMLLFISVLISVGGILLARYIYLKRMNIVAKLTQTFSGVYKFFKPKDSEIPINQAVTEKKPKTIKGNVITFGASWGCLQDIYISNE